MAAVASADANFHHGRLRLSIFLRAVEQSDMPQRPSRFRRRFKASDESSRELNDRPVQDGDHQEPGTCALIDSPSPIHSPAPSDPIATVSDKATHVPNSLEDRLETSDDHADVADDIAERLTGLSEPPSIQNTPRTRKQLEVTTSSKTRVYKAHSDSSSTRKRRLPVNCLALLRTSTLEGLPEPGVSHRRLHHSLRGLTGRPGCRDHVCYADRRNRSYRRQPNACIICSCITCYSD